MTVLSRSFLVRAALAGAFAALLASGCTSLAQKERELTFRVVKGDAGWYSGTPATVQDVYIPVNGAGGGPRHPPRWWAHAAARAPGGC
jgi:hypothetical protein